MTAVFVWQPDKCTPHGDSLRAYHDSLRLFDSRIAAPPTRNSVLVINMPLLVPGYLKQADTTRAQTWQGRQQQAAGSSRCCRQ